MNERDALILLNSVKGLGPVRIKTLLSRFGTPQDIFGVSLLSLREAGLSETVAQALLQAPDLFPLQRELEWVRKQGVQVVTFLEENYPKLLKEIHDPPVVLYVKGELRPDDLSLAIVGSRKGSSYGLKVAEEIARQLVEYGLTVVSGLARGIDTASHEGALKAKGRTVAVLGSGLWEIYPPENRSLSSAIALSGALVSEFSMTQPALPENFPRRNRLISGLSVGVLVVEADEKSGALITAHAAMEQGREVFAIPGRVDSPLSRGTHRLIQEGAKLVQDLSDILEELKIPIVHATPPLLSQAPPSLSGEEEVIYETLSDFPKSVDLIAEESHLSADTTLSTLVRLELKKLVKAFPGQHYTRR